MTAVAYGLVQFVTEPIFYTIPQMLLDYPLAFGALGLAGFFNRKMGTSDWICSRRFRTFSSFPRSLALYFSHPMHRKA